MKLNVLVSHPQEEIRECFSETIEKSGSTCIEVSDITSDKRISQYDADIIFAPFYDGNNEPFIVSKASHTEGMLPLYIALLEEDNPKDQSTILFSNVFDTIPFISEPELIQLKLEVYKHYVHLIKTAGALVGRDLLTGLEGRDLFREALKKEMVRSDELPGFFSVTILAIDFSLIPSKQSSYEYAVEFIRRGGNYLSSIVRAHDRIYHIFPDQFAIIHPEANELTGEKAARRIKESLYEEAKSWPNGDLKFFLSTGSATYSPSENLKEPDLIEMAYENLNWERKFQALPKRVTEQPKTDNEEKVILVIDDDPVTRAYLEKLLTKEGYHVLLAESGQKGRRLLEEKRPQVVLLDWMMPGLDGMEFCRRVRSTPSLCSVYIIVLSMISGTESVVYALETGADDYLSKPLHDKRQELLARIEVGFRIQKMQEKALQAERLQGVLEMAGAFAHEINQPLMAMAGLVDLLFMDLDKNHPGFDVAGRLKKQIYRLGKLTKKLNHITRYETVEYPDGIKLFDIEKSSEE